MSLTVAKQSVAVVQIVLEKSMQNIIAATLSENLESTIVINQITSVKRGVSTWCVKAKVLFDGKELTLHVNFSVLHPDKSSPWFRTDPNAIVKIVFDGERQHFVYEALCDCEDLLGYIPSEVIVRMSSQHGFEWWMIAESSQVSYRGSHGNLMPWVKEKVKKYWPHLSHVHIDT